MGCPKDTKWDRVDVSKKKNVSAADKETLFRYYEAGLKIGKTSEEVLEELSERYNRSPRQIQRYISQVTERMTKESLGNALDQVVNINAYVEHIAEIHTFIERWKGLIENRNSRVRVVWPPYYHGLERDELFSYVLRHCPSINVKYQALKSVRDKYESEKESASKVGNYGKTFAEAEKQLRHAIEMGLLSHEYSRHRCDLCPSVRR